ncbi:common plant regulatory factor 1 [Pyrus x bretschneideri]|uniref:common plant regulatory factor 1 n=1 Tax=Pyrus x bretschneideri TaxID=225117 RepID=UPI00202F9EFF|nr:common plant regulatory factor 1 [Pyrus x bretschneideri]XP_048421994.1 common plant regulatory factor 1 [Pyrus x bretschneideri]
MGNDDDAKSVKSEKSYLPLPAGQANPNNQTNMHVYPDWAAMQAYYGPRVALPPYYNSAMASGHPPHPYMWPPPQHMMPPYGAPYAVYSHGGVYAHPAVPLASHGQGGPSSPAAVTPLNMETPTKSSGNTDRGLMKKLKGFDGLAMSIGSGNVMNAEGGAERSLSQSSGTEGSSNGSDGNTAAANQTRRKRSREGTPATAGEGKTDMQPGPAEEASAATDKVLGVTLAAVGIPGKLVGPAVSPGMTTALELKNLPILNSKTSPTTVPQSCAVLPPETWIHNDREIKRERRKQSNRESARRSRLRKQAETEELARKVEALSADNVALKSEINRLTENSATLRLENTTLLDKLKNARVGRMEDIIMNIDDKRVQPFSTENLLSRVNNAGSIARDAEKDSDAYEKNNGTKLHQLLDASPRADAVAAG